MVYAGLAVSTPLGWGVVTTVFSQEGRALVRVDNKLHTFWLTELS